MDTAHSLSVYSCFGPSELYYCSAVKPDASPSVT